MMQYYTLEQAAELLKVSTDKLREMVKLNKLRAFQDRGSLRFRARDVEELARAWGLGSDAELQAADPPSSKSSRPGSSGKRRSDLAAGGGTFEVADEEQVPLGKNPSKLDKGSSSKRRSTPSSHSKSPPPKASSDSGVRLVPDGSDMDFKIEVDSDDNVPVGREGKRPSKVGSGSKPLSDSEIQMVPMDGSSDSDVKIQPRSHASKVELGQMQEKTPSDSDIRMEADVRELLEGSSDNYDPLITEEIDLEIEPEAPPAKKEKRSKYKQGSGGSLPALPTESPFELSENDFDVDEGKKEAPLTEDSSEFHLDMDGSSPLTGDEDEIKLEDLSDDAKGGINLSKPADSGISLEDDAGLEFELSADGESTPPPGSSTDSSGDFDLSLEGDDPSAEFELSTQGGDDDSSSEFELSIDGEDSSSEFELTLQEDQEGTSSEFELSLDQEEDSSSEFELTIDEEEESEEDRDIFETDFEVPALDDESDSVETDEDSSEFELDLDEDFVAEEDEDSALVEIDEDEEVDDAARTVQRRRPAALKSMDDDELDLEIDPGAVFDEEEEEEEESVAGPAPQVPWGAFPAVMLFPCVIILFVVGLMVFELTQGMWGYHKRSKVTSLVVDPIARQIDDKLPKQD
jgi:excisionase family DNA binding protein